MGNGEGREPRRAAEKPGCPADVQPESVVVPVGTAVDFFSSLGVGVEKAACHTAGARLGLGVGAG